MQLVFYWAPKLARKCESKHWFPCGADGRWGARLDNFDLAVTLLTEVIVVSDTRSKYLECNNIRFFIGNTAFLISCS